LAYELLRMPLPRTLVNKGELASLLGYPIPRREEIGCCPKR
jgi:hypothetical protein